MPAALKKPRDHFGAGEEVYTDRPWEDPLPDGLLQGLSTLAVTPISAVDWRLVPKYFQGPRITTDINWMVFDGVEATVTVGPDHRRCRVQPGDSIFLPSGTRHYERITHDRDWSLLSIHFTATVYGQVDVLRSLGFPYHLPSAALPLTATARTLIREYRNQSPGWALRSQALLTEVLFTAIRNHGDRFREVESTPLDSELMRLAPVHNLIEERFGDPTLTIGDLAAALETSEVTLRKLYRKASGMSPVEGIQEKRIRHACRELRRTNRPVKEIAAESGFRDLAFFYRVFKKWMGLPPAAWRQESAL
ncbi:MAG: helix-turn-helix domain-containing protein [Planctomycetota bacterium]|jgi:AraC-like DNA-binding protein